jgi:internalin A
MASLVRAEEHHGEGAAMVDDYGRYDGDLEEFDELDEIDFQGIDPIGEDIELDFSDELAGESKAAFDRDLEEYEGRQRADDLRQRLPDLSHLSLWTLPSEIFDECNIESLDLYDNNLTGLPETVCQLSSLTFLDASSNRLSSLPKNFGALQNLSSLSLQENNLRVLPRDFFQLKKLKILDLSDNKLTVLPSAIGNMQDLEKLDLSDNPIVELPSTVGRLSKLRVLRLGRTGLTVVPSAIGNMQDLEELDLSDNPIVELPSTVGRLSKLRVLRLGRTGLTSLPKAISRLRNLQELDLSGASLTELPPQIGKLERLQVLYLSNNRLTRLPKELADLSDSVVIDFDLNPLEEPLPLLIGRGTFELFTYLRSLDVGEPQYEAKVLLIGEGNVGKSSLVAALLGQPFIENRPTTHGIELGTLHIKHPRLRVAMTLNTWDFGGQEVYRITHQFFFSARSLYIVVWRPREGQEENAIEAWCERIRLRVGDEARILIVATHCEERRAELDYPYLKQKFGDMLAGHFVVDNRTGRGIDSLRRAIAKKASKLPQMGELMNPRWTSAQEEVASLRGYQIPYWQFESICREKLLSDAETQTLSKLLHDLGHIIHYRTDDGLREVVVLQPEWLTKAIGLVLEDEETRRSGGILRHARLREIWRGKGARQPYLPVHHPYFLRMMEKFDVSYRLPDEDASLVGQLVPYERPRIPWDSGESTEPTLRRLYLVCSMNDEAPGLIAWLTVRNHRFSTGLHWRRGVFLRHAGYASEALFELLEDKRQLALTVRAPSPDYFFTILRDSVEDLIKRRWKGLKYDLLVPCLTQTSDDERCPGKLRFATLQKFRERGRSDIICHDCAEPQDIARLLTGFEAFDAPLQHVLDEVREQQKAVVDNLQRIEAYAADAALQVRAVLRASSAEITDCPRLFTLIPASPRGLERTQIWQGQYRLTLWCEHAGHEHAWPSATYRISFNKEWFQRIAPYAILINKALKVIVPIGAAVTGIAIDENRLKQVQAEIDLMKVLVEKLPQGGDATSSRTTGQLTSAEGSGLRALRALLFAEDAPRFFGDLRRVLTTAGDFLWVCPLHYLEYDPGLPSLPK